jgi:UDP-N-acetyl-D-mannosaminuronate dehydrogenase
VQFESDVVVIGGCGHVGLPLAIVMADRGQKVIAYDINHDTVDLVNRGEMPFEEPGAPQILSGFWAMAVSSRRLIQRRSRQPSTLSW